MQAAEGFRFLDVDMPNQFVLECLDTHGEWIDWELSLNPPFVPADAPPRVPM